MHPFLLETHLPGLGPLDVPSYFLLVMTAFLVGSSLVVREFRRHGYRMVDGLDLSLLVLVAGMAGGRLAFVLLAAPDIELAVPAQSNLGWEHVFCRAAGEDHAVTRDWNLGRYYLLHPQMVLAVWTGGFVFYGGLLVIPALWWFCRRRNLRFWQTADLIAPTGAAALALGRVGCLLASCCHGGAIPESLAKWGVVFERGVPRDLQGVALWPTQTMESVVALGIAWALYRMRRTKRFDGQVFAALLLLYGAWRPLNEMLRADPQRGEYAGLSTSQWISVAVLVAGTALVPILWKRRTVPHAGGPAPAQVPAAAAGAPS